MLQAENLVDFKVLSIVSFSQTALFLIIYVGMVLRVLNRIKPLKLQK